MTGDHPTLKTGDELDELRKSDPAAFDMDDAADTGDEPAPPTATPTDDEPADPPEPKDDRPRDANGKFVAKDAADDAPPADEPGDGKPAAKADEDGDKVERRAYDGVLTDLQRTREENRTMKERLAAIEAERKAAETGEGRDFDAEIKALEDKYDDGDIEFVDYQKDMTALVAAKTRAEVLTEVETRRQETEKQTAERQWAEARSAFLAVPEHAELVSNKYRRAAFLEALQDAADEGITDNAALLAAARDKVLAEFPQAKAKPDAKPDEPPADPHANRKAADAAAASRAAAAPPTINGGKGDRTGVDSAVDLANLKPGNFSKLSAAEQEKLLGEGAL